MDDLIYKQVAIDAFRKELCGEREYAIGFGGIERILNGLPVAKDINVPVKDLISRQAVLEPYQTLDDSDTICIWLLRKNIEQTPSVQPKPGKWIEVNDNYNRISGRCSVCGWESHMYEDDVVGMDYCPNCGTKMERTE